MSSIIDTSDKLIALGGSFTGILAASLYALYRRRHETAAQIKSTETVKLGPELEKRLQSEDNCSIAYAAVEGVVTDLGETFRTANCPKKGVVLQTSLIEHKSKRSQGFWADVKNAIRNTLDVAPFALADPEKSGSIILVTDPTEAEGLLDNLEVTHNTFIPHQTTPVQYGIDRIFGEVCRGLQETEEMLVVGTNLVGIGEILLENGTLKLRPPDADGSRYFLTRLTKNQLVKHFQSQATILKVVSICFGVLTISLLGWITWRIAKKYLALRKRQREFDDIRLNTLQRHARSRPENAGTSEVEDSCVVCLANPREVVTLDCGHISMCSDCAQMLPQPYKCPVCREPIHRFLPVYRP